MFVSAATALSVACGPTASAPGTSATPTGVVQVSAAPATATAVPATPTPQAPTAMPVTAFTPEASQRNTAGVPLPAAPGARSVVVTYTPAPSVGPQVKSGTVTVSVGDNYFAPDELHVTAGTIVEWQYDGGGGETESIHNVIALDKSFNSGDLNPGTRFSFSFATPGEFAYVCSYHAVQMTGKIIVQ
ncbi:MAG TPA: cupredoxin domain-containing protein [Chloroflexota bacterium]